MCIVLVIISVEDLTIYLSGALDTRLLDFFILTELYVLKILHFWTTWVMKIEYSGPGPKSLIELKFLFCKLYY